MLCKEFFIPKGSSYAKVFGVDIEKQHALLIFEEGNPLWGIIREVLIELEKADNKYEHDKMENMQVGFKTIGAEYAELDREIERFAHSIGHPKWLRKEAVQVSAMGVKFIRDICNQLEENV